MHIRLATNDDEEKWNSFTSQHAQASPYHHFAWKKTIEKAYGHQCYYLIAENSEQEIVGVLPSVSIIPPFIAGKLCALPFCDLGASLVTDDLIEEQLIDKGSNITLQHKLSVFEYRASQRYDLHKDHTEDLSKDQKVRMLLELPGSSEELLASFKAKLRSQIKKAVKNGLTVELGQSDQLINEFYDVFTCNMKDLGSPTHSKSWFKEIKNNYMKDMIVSVIKHEGKPVGAGIVLFNGTIAAIPWASTKREYNRLSPNMLLYWSLLEYTTDHGYRVFDFGRSSYGEGTFKFKRQWGARPVPLKWQTFSNKGNKISANSGLMPSNKNRIRTITESIWRKLPLPATTLIGPKLRKYISL